MSDQAVVEKQALTWAALWRSGEPYSTPSYPVHVQQLPSLLPCSLRSAAASFPLGTGLGSDNISPRAILRLSDAALAALAVLRGSFELLGHWTQALDLVLIVLLPKTDGGFRPIGLFPTIIRVWMRARMFAARAWIHSLSG